MISYHGNNIANALVDLFPHIGFAKSRFQDTRMHQLLFIYLFIYLFIFVFLAVEDY